MASASTLPVSQIGSVLIVGAGLAGLRTAQALRGHGFTGHITVIGAESHAPYDRPPLSKHLFDNDSPVFLSSDIGADLHTLADQVLLGRRVVELIPQPSGWRVGSVPATFNDDIESSDESPASQRGSAPLPGGSFAHAGIPTDSWPTNDMKPEAAEHLADAVVLALGAAPVILPSLEQAVTLHTWDDAHTLRSILTARVSSPAQVSLAPASHPDTRGPLDQHSIASLPDVPAVAASCDIHDLLIVGAGWIGVELAAVARAQGLSVCVVEASSAPLERHLGVEIGERIAEWIHENHGELLTDSQVRMVDTDANGVSRVLVVNGTGDERELRARAVVSAIGARPATTWLPNYIVTSAHGAVLTDPRGQVYLEPNALPTNLNALPKHLYAVGDCAIREDAVHGRVTGGHWAVALNDPERIAAALTGSDLSIRPAAPHVFSTQFGHDVNLFGTPDLDHDKVIFRDYPDGSWTALYVRPDEAPPSVSETDSAQPTGAITGYPERWLVDAVFTVDAPRDASQARKLTANGPFSITAVNATDLSLPLKNL